MKKKIFVILGNQLFNISFLQKFKNDHIFFLSEDLGLCTYEKHHKQKILLFLSSMRSYSDSLKKNKFKIEYQSIDNKSFKLDYFEKVKKFVKAKQIKEISCFEIEDKFFENKIIKFAKKEKLNLSIAKKQLLQTRPTAVN